MTTSHLSAAEYHRLVVWGLSLLACCALLAMRQYAGLAWPWWGIVSPGLVWAGVEALWRL